eukprot:3961142-Amphidinium_carterae.2
MHDLCVGTIHITSHDGTFVGTADGIVPPFDCLQSSPHHTQNKAPAPRQFYSPQAQIKWFTAVWSTPSSTVMCKFEDSGTVTEESTSEPAQLFSICHEVRMHKCFRIRLSST